MKRNRTATDDWYPERIPEHALIDDAAYVETTFNHGVFPQFPRPPGFAGAPQPVWKRRLTRGPNCCVELGENQSVIICNSDTITSGYALLACDGWIGFDSCVLPRLTIGKGAVGYAKSVVTENSPLFSRIAGNPDRAIRNLNQTENKTHA